ncbi:unnamed protein product [Prorocentrum cordatum]|uniref:Uncharacterized protein n=1 Tax=Prorocentrum cordatum TaxID=2364126 RepID=A0ABN9V401_9DINO|nr:unnamed protein product [Polarella glacialis]
MRANVAALLALALPEGLPCLDLAGRNATAAASAAAQGWEQLSSALAAGRFPGATGDVLALAVPRATCSCQLDRWDQYAVCKGAYERGAQALSFGIKGYDEWARHVQHEHARLVPKLYDCYDTRKPAGFDNEFFPTCVGGKAGQRGGRAFETLRRLLPAGANQSARHRSTSRAASSRSWSR